MKETALDWIAESEIDIAEAVSFENFPAHLVKDLFFAARRSKKPRLSDGGDKFCRMGISELRRLALDKGLDVDGSREALISALRESSALLPEQENQ